MASAFEHAQRDSFDEDLVLVERFVYASDEAAFDAIYRKYYDKVQQIAMGVLLRQEEALDAVQEIFTLVYRHLGRFDRRSRFSTWLFRIAVNRSIQQARRASRHSRETALADAFEVADPSAVPEVKDPQIALAMEQLAPDDRAVLTLFYWDELSLQEISESLGCSANAAKTRLFRARDRFKKFYEEAA